jgi:hypothetical protein
LDQVYAWHQQVVIVAFFVCDCGDDYQDVTQEVIITVS